MTSYIDGEIPIFLWSILSGVIIMAVYDIFSIAAHKERYSIFVCNIFDGVFVLSACVIMIFILLSVSNGYIRGFEFIGAFIGALTYKLTLSPIFILIFSKIIEFIFAVFRFFLKILLTPLRFTYKIIYNTISVLFKFSHKTLSPVILRGSRFFSLVKISLKKT